MIRPMFDPTMNEMLRWENTLSETKDITAVAEIAITDVKFTVFL